MSFIRLSIQDESFQLNYIDSGISGGIMLGDCICLFLGERIPPS